MILDSSEYKKQLSLYKTYVDKRDKYNEKADIIFDRLASISSPAPSFAIVNGKEVPIPKSHGDPHMIEQAKLESIDEMNDYRNMAKMYQDKIDEVDRITNQLPKYLKEIVAELYFNRKNLEYVASKVGYSKNGLVYFLNKHLDMEIMAINNSFVRYEKKK